MPRTPRFSLRQDDEFLYIVIRVPWVRVSEAETHLDGRNFSFFCKPFLLKLLLPGEVVDDDRCKGVYDVNDEHGTITVHVPKANPGESLRANLRNVSEVLRLEGMSCRVLMPKVFQAKSFPIWI